MPNFRFLVRTETLKRAPPMLWHRKKLTNLEQCQMSRKFISSYWVDAFRAILEFFCVQMSNGDALDFKFQFRLKTLKMGLPMLWPRKKLPNLKQCRRSRKFTSRYWVVSFRVMLEYFCLQLSNGDALHFAFQFQPKTLKRRPQLLWPRKKLPNL